MKQKTKARRKDPQLKIIFGVVGLCGLIGAGYMLSMHRSVQSPPLVLALDYSQGHHATTYLGLTTAGYTGNLGGPGGANAKCQTYFGANAHMCTQREIIRSGVTSLAGYGWISCEFTHNNNVDARSCDGLSGSVWSSNISLGFTCTGWTYPYSDQDGAVAAVDGTLSGQTCNNSYQIHCCL